MTVRDTRMMERALRERWPIKPEYRERIMLYLYTIVGSKDASPRERTAAAKALMAADSLNVQQERMDQADEHERRQRMVELARQLSPGEVARLSAESGVVVDGFVVDEYDGEEIEGRGEDGPKEGGGT
jgi:hypothetical protein